jgi:hypothetical protein
MIVVGRDSNNGQSFYGYLDVMPNPTNGIFTVHVNTNDATIHLLNIKIYNPLGIEIFSTIEIGNTIKLDLSSVAKGIYYLQVKKTNQLFNQKIILN